MLQLEGRKTELERQLTDAETPPPLLHPEMATFYREQVNALHEVLRDDTEATRRQAGEILRSLVKEIILTRRQVSSRLMSAAIRPESWRFPSKRKPRPQGPGFRKLRWLRGHATTDTDIRFKSRFETSGEFHRDIPPPTPHSEATLCAVTGGNIAELAETAFVALLIVLPSARTIGYRGE